MLSCKQTTELLSTDLDQRLTGSRYWALRMHLLVCKNCRRYRQQLRVIQHALSLVEQRIDFVRLSDDAKRRIKSRLDQG